MEFGDQANILKAAVEQPGAPVILTTGELEPPGPAIIYVNDAFLRLTGYTREELVGATPRILQGPATDRFVLDRLNADLRAGHVFEGRTWNYRKDGTAYQVHWTILPLRLAGEEIDHFVSIQRDVTQQDDTQPYQDPNQETLGNKTRRLITLLRSATTSHDPVTGLLNYWGMLLELQRLIDGTQTTDSATGLIKLRFIDLERVYEAYGIEAILHLLSDIGERLANRLEPSESLARPYEYIFAIIIPMDTETTDEADRHLLARAQALVAAVTEKGFNVAGDVVDVEVGVGIARAPTDSVDPPELAVYAQEAARRAANTNATRICWAVQGIRDTGRHQLALEHRLRRAIGNHDLRVVYQPIIALSNNEVVGAEALVLWPQPEGQAPIGPHEFIPLAEELGLMDLIAIQVFEQACRQLRSWQKRPGNDGFQVSVNTAPVQLGNPHLADELIAITRKKGVSPSSVMLEITESALEQSFDQASYAIDRLVAAGFPLALDDFGKGNSPLGRLIELPFSVLKVDRSFVAQTPDGRGAAFVASLSHLSEHLQIQALGEGVETAAHEAFLRECGYAYAQGYYYGKPMAPVEFAASLGWAAE